MKKKLLISSVVLILILTGCGNNMEENTPKIYDDYGRDVLPGVADYYYTFTGESEHFTFSDGIADYRDDKAELVIDGLKQKNQEEFTTYVRVYFNDKLFSSRAFNNELITEDNRITGVWGKKIKRNADGNMYGEIDAFMETEPDNFANAIKIIANYCDAKDNCQDEEFKLNIIKNEEISEIH
ncbi:MAG: hypothetical protein K2J20_00725 [Bacilli bacterium]|nr:hypothetical protein [Bacilli bacterium]